MLVKATSNLKYLSPLFAMCTILGIVPYQSNSMFYKTYKIIIILLHIIGHLWMFSAKFTPLFDGFDAVVILSDQIYLMTLLFVCLSMVICSTFYDPGKFKKMLKLYDFFDKNNGFCRPSNKVYFWFVIFYIHLKMVLIVCLDAWSWGNSDVFVIMIKYYFPRHLQMYAMGVTDALGLWLISELHFRFKYITTFLNDSFRASNSEDIVTISSAPQHTDLLKRIKKVLKYHHVLCDILSILNVIFGVTILFEVLFNMSFAYAYVVFIIFYTLYDDGSNSDYVGVGMKLRITCFIWFSEALINIFLLALAGDRIAKEANSIIPVCYKILHQLDSNVLLDSHLLKEELKMLIQQVIQRKPCINAAGFFVVDFGMLGFVVTSFTSYIIVAVQFLLKPSK